jgi:hypothetical protein
MSEEVKVINEELGAIRVTDTQQLRLRRRTLEGVKPMLELSNWNPDVGYHLNSPFPDDPRILRQLISLFQHTLEAGHGEA